MRINSKKNSDSPLSLEVVERDDDDDDHDDDDDESCYLRHVDRSINFLDPHDDHQTIVITISF